MHPKGLKALELGRAGFRVHPLEVNTKEPHENAFGHLARSAKTDAGCRKIEWWWRQKDYNIGIATGPGGPFIVTDVDVKKGKKGLASLKTLEEKYDLPQSYRVRTPSGGIYVYLRMPKGVYIGNGTSWLPEECRDGIDIRGNGVQGNIAAPGSTIDGKEYTEITSPGDMADVPEKLLKLIETAATTELQTRKTRTPACELDTPHIISKAIEWLKAKDGAPAAKEGESGDTTTVYVAMCLSDMGVSETKALELMDVHWNHAPDQGGKADPPWDLDELELKVRNGYAYAHNQPGERAPVDPMEEFGAVDIPIGRIVATPVRRIDPACIPPRQWIVKDVALRGKVSALISPGGFGKTSFIVRVALAVATGRTEVLGLPVEEQAPVWFWNQEDDLDELDRRVAAARLEAKLEWDDIPDNLYLSSGIALEKPLTLAKRLSDGSLGASKDLEEIISEIKRNGIGLLIMDPLQEVHEGKENANEEMRLVFAMARRIAVATGCAVLLAAHTRKPSEASSDGFAGDADSLRGASSQTGVARIISTLCNMSKKDAIKHGIPETERHLYVRLDLAKSNMSLKSGEPDWYKRIGVPLTSHGESVGTLAPVRLEEAKPSDNMHIIENVAAAIDALGGHGEWLKLSDVLPLLSSELQGAFKDPKNHARVLTALLHQKGVAFSDKQPEPERRTRHGLLRMKKARGKNGTQFLLAPGAGSVVSEFLTNSSEEFDELVKNSKTIGVPVGYGESQSVMRN